MADKTNYKIYNATLKDVAYSIRYITKNPALNIRFLGIDITSMVKSEINKIGLPMYSGSMPIIKNLPICSKYVRRPFAEADPSYSYYNIPGSIGIKGYQDFDNNIFYLYVSSPYPVYLDRGCTRGSLDYVYEFNKEVFDSMSQAGINTFYWQGVDYQHQSQINYYGNGKLTREISQVSINLISNIPNTKNILNCFEGSIYGGGYNRTFNQLNENEYKIFDNLFLKYGEMKDLYNLYEPYAYNCYKSPYGWNSGISYTSRGSSSDMTYYNNSFINFPLTIETACAEMHSNLFNAITDIFHPYRTHSIYFRNGTMLQNIHGYENSFLPLNMCYAFQDCKNLENFYINNFYASKKFIYRYYDMFMSAFQNCYKLKSTFNIIPYEKNDYFHLNNTVFSHIFENCYSLQHGINFYCDLVCDNHVEFYDCFGGCNNIKSTFYFQNVFCNDSFECTESSGSITDYSAKKDYEFNHISCNNTCRLSFSYGNNISENHIPPLFNSMYSEKNCYLRLASEKTFNLSNYQVNMYSKKEAACHIEDCSDLGGEFYLLTEQKMPFLEAPDRLKTSSHLNVFLLNRTSVKKEFTDIMNKYGYAVVYDHDGMGTYEKISDSHWKSTAVNVDIYFIDSVPFKYLLPDDWRKMYG